MTKNKTNKQENKKQHRHQLTSKEIVLGWGWKEASSPLLIMVLLSAPLLERFTASPCRRVPFHASKFFHAEKTNPDRFWKRRKFFLMTANLPYRARNCSKLTSKNARLLLAREHDLWSKGFLKK